MLKRLFWLSACVAVLTCFIVSCSKDSSDDPIIAEWIGVSQQIDTYQGDKITSTEEVKINRLAIDFYPDDTFTLSGNIGQDATANNIEGTFALYGSKITFKYMDKSQKSQSFSVDYRMNGGLLEIKSTIESTGSTKKVKTTTFGKA
ncbi:hypothetical protein HMPREF0765_1208 [Sphingobacterium spiritivorum ATCC 33300]|uniref:Lipocalin-like domain-containing protein n=1 Tax=Sphingobacterium spiritivorum ATCC 33300 TaxID=525372 RepID=C2FV52_SPHSI|nr:lipocalin family protein [Sphingobacterium spiritivorum]EEI93175.1 hypothetical protein HMPREF0765_1208 [Sphingobacterium spiritivorum ATCC 33300]QQS96087.1 hypothetical protein I6J03_22410 [Sphingobacterium spiritivorum]